METRNNLDTERISQSSLDPNSAYDDKELPGPEVIKLFLMLS